MATLASQTHTNEEAAGYFPLLLLSLAHRTHRAEPAASERVYLSSLNPALPVANRLGTLHGAPLLRPIW